MRPKESNTHPHFPDEILLCIFSFITEEMDYRHIRQVSRKFRRIVNDKALWARDNLHVAKFEDFGKDADKEFDERKELFQLFMTGVTRIRIYILHKEALRRLFFSEIYKSIWMMPGNYLYLSNSIYDLCDVKIVKNLSSDQLDTTISAFLAAVTQLKDQWEITQKRFRPVFRTKHSLTEAYCQHALFIVRHPYLRNKLSQLNLLDLANFSVEMANTIIRFDKIEKKNIYAWEIVNTIIREDIPALSLEINETFFKILAASLKIDEYQKLDELYRIRAPSTGILAVDYLHRLFLEDMSSDKPVTLDKHYDKDKLVQLALVDDRIAMLWVMTPYLCEQLSNDHLITLALKEVSIGAEHWARQDWYRDCPKANIFKYSVDFPDAKRCFTRLAEYILFTCPLQDRMVRCIQTLQWVRIHTRSTRPQQVKVMLYETHITFKGNRVIKLYLEAPRYSELNNLVSKYKQSQVSSSFSKNRRYNVKVDKSQSIAAISSMSSNATSQVIQADNHTYKERSHQRYSSKTQGYSMLTILSHVFSGLMLVFGIIMLSLSLLPAFALVASLLKMIGVLSVAEGIAVEGVTYLATHQRPIFPQASTYSGMGKKLWGSAQVDDNRTDSASSGNFRYSAKGGSSVTNHQPGSPPPKTPVSSATLSNNIQKLSQ